MGAMELSNNGKLGFVFIGSVLYTFSVLCNLALLLVIAVNKMYRFQGSPRLLQQMMGMLFAVVSPSLNPLIYGIKSKEIKVKLKQLFFQLPGTGGLKVQVNTVSM
ncbi:olfactory receptor 51I1-like [Hypomesus transpacificus]|uniref:olfactory receptor 51I1-like n=1 Tax=Hypomesus transpacificus TaxID=137520 RepID=UPI001F07E729|nr:olfactory receptor 51I1-like [Hypomesus transpacificus]